MQECDPYINEKKEESKTVVPCQKVYGEIMNPQIPDIVYTKSINWNIDAKILMTLDKAECFCSPSIKMGPRKELMFNIEVTKYFNNFIIFSINLSMIFNINKETINHDMWLVFYDKKNSKKEISKTKLDHYSRECSVNDKQLFYVKVYEIIDLVKETGITESDLIICVKLEVSMRVYENLYEDFSDKFKKIYKNSMQADVVLVIMDNDLNKDEFLVHKTILMARSEVFQAMFECDFEEKRTRKVVIHDTNRKAMNEFLYYLYTNEINSQEYFNENITEILMLSDKYLIYSLKEVCELKLIDGITIDNVVDLCIIADNYNLNLLKKTATRKIINFCNNSCECFKRKCKNYLPLDVINEVFNAHINLID